MNEMLSAKFATGRDHGEVNSVSSPRSFGAETRSEAQAPTIFAVELADAGKVRLDSALLRRLRQSRLLSQQDLAEECWRRNIQVSIATIKRAELGRAVRFRIARELARCFDVPLRRIVRLDL